MIAPVRKSLNGHAAPIEPTADGAGLATTGGAAPGGSALTPEMRAGVEKFRHAVQLCMGQIVLATMNLPRYRNQTLGDLTHLFVTPLLRDRVAIARKTVKGADGAARPEEAAVTGFALWATVSDAVDARITEQIRAGVFPIRLAAEDWTSGETVWLLDLIAADRRQATSVLANFRQLAGDRPVKITPLVATLIDPEVAAMLRGAVANGESEALAMLEPQRLA